MVITWKTRNLRSLFTLSDKNDCKLCVIVLLVHLHILLVHAEVTWNEHNNPTKSSEPSKIPSKQHQPLFYMGCHFKCSKMVKPGRT